MKLREKPTHKKFMYKNEELFKKVSRYIVTHMQKRFKSYIGYDNSRK